MKLLHPKNSFTAPNKEEKKDHTHYRDVNPNEKKKKPRTRGNELCAVIRRNQIQASKNEKSCKKRPLKDQTSELSKRSTRKYAIRSLSEAES